jgi:GT2 family glycosyltransferase/glycosyltransferase involved in cell wall biosynthesis
MPQAIDIIIPVYNAYDDLRRCLDSVRRTTAARHRIILIDDGSPDPRIGQYFASLRADSDPCLTLLTNEVNLGFVGTVNRGMALGRNDVVLLNSDTIVTSDWVEKLCRCAAFDARIGTITPFSNNAEICSFPNFCQDNALPDGLDAEDVNCAIEAAALPTYPDIPTAVGFCMYIRRELLDAIGLFDSETFRLGYGEENDFCMRAKIAGWRNVLCDDTFVQHVGSRSFDTKKKALAEENMKRLLAKHPDYMRQVMVFIAADPIKPIRQLAKTLLTLSDTEGAKPGILHIMHGRSGGTEQHIRDLMHSDGGRCRHYLLSTMEDVWQVKDANSGELLSFQFRYQADQLWADFLGGLCATFRIQMCHVHHLAGCRAGLLEAFRALDIPYGFSVHDFFLACPTINLLNDAGAYCSGEIDLARCRSCLDGQTDFRGIDIAAWREAHAAFIKKAIFVIAPSRWAAEMFRHYFPRDDIRVIPHGVDASMPHGTEMPTAKLMPRDGRTSIGVLGAIGPVKGARRLEALVARSRERKLPLRWVVIGYLDRQFQAHQDADTLLTIHGQYLPEHMEALLDHYRVDLVLFPSAGPETYCYTLTEAWMAGRPVLVPPIGALHERVQSSGAGWSMLDWRNIDAILDDVIAILQPENRPDFDRRQSQTRSVPVASICDMANATETIYREFLAGREVSTSSRAAAVALQPAALRAAQQTALGVAAAEKRRAESRSESWLLNLAHFGLRMRYTALGRLLYRVIPVRWQQILKRRLLA